MTHAFRTAAALLLLAIAPAFAQTPAPAPAAKPPAPVAAPMTTPAATPAAKPAARATKPAAAGGKVDINSATAAQLDALPQIGPVRSKAIVAGRPYEELQDLVKKKVLSQGIFDKAKGGMALANINTSTAAEMAKTLPGIGEVRAKEIVAGRPYASPQDLVTKKVLTDGVFDKMKDLVAW